MRMDTRVSLDPLTRPPSLYLAHARTAAAAVSHASPSSRETRRPRPADGRGLARRDVATRAGEQTPSFLIDSTHALTSGQTDGRGTREECVSQAVSHSVGSVVALLEVASSSAIIREREAVPRAFKVEPTMGGTRIKAHCPRARASFPRPSKAAYQRASFSV